MKKITFVNKNIFIVLLIMHSCLLFITGCPSYSENQKSHQNQKPTAIVKAESEQPILLTDPNMVCRLDASESFDPNGDRLTYIWYSINNEIELDLSNPVSPKVPLPKKPGNYYFILQVYDGISFSEIATVKITVKSPDAWVDSTLLADIPYKYQYKTIQDAIDAIDAIREPYDEAEKVIAIITPGPYREKITVKPHIYLIGLKSEKAGLPHVVSFVNDGDAAVTLYGYTTIDNLDISVIKNGSGDSNSSEKSAIKVAGEKAKIHNCKIQNSYSDGITLKEGSDAEVTNTLLAEIDGEGIIGEKDSRLKVEGCRVLYTGGSALFGQEDANSVEISNSIIYCPGWDGLDLKCRNTRVEHCTIVDFGRWDAIKQRSGISISGSGSVTIKSNLIEIQDKPPLSNPALGGITMYGDHYIEDLKFNYIYSKQQDNTYYTYYDGNITIENVDQTNLPNRETRTTDDPRIIDPNNGDFRLDKESPALASGRGEKETAPGADGDILKPYAPSSPVLSSPPPGQLVDPNNLIFT
jgi:hypothetical protein